MRQERTHERESWCAGIRRCRVRVVTYTDFPRWQGSWVSTTYEPCTEHPPLTGKRYEKPEASGAGDDCDEYECCTNHERVERLVLAAFQLGRETK